MLSKKGSKCPFRHSQPEQPAVHAKAEPPPKEDAESSSRGRTGDRSTGKMPRHNSPWKDPCPAGLKCKGIADRSCGLWHPAARGSPSASPSPSRGSDSSASVSDMVKRAGFGSAGHINGFVHVVPPEQAYLNLATAKEASPQRRIRFSDAPAELGAVSASLQRDPCVAVNDSPASSAMRQGQSEKFQPHPELPENLLTREATRQFIADFTSRDVTSAWFKLTEHARRCSVLQGFSWPAELNTVIASCLYYELPLTAPIRKAWDRVVVKGSHCPLTKQRTWFGEPPTDSECRLPQAGVIDLSGLHSAVEAAAAPGVFFVQDPGYNTVFDSGCSPVALTNSSMPGLRNIRSLPPAEWFKVRGIGGEITIQHKGELHYRVRCDLYHPDPALRADLTAFQVQLSREDPLFYYFVIPCFIDDALPSGVTLVSLGQAVWNLDWCVQLAKDPKQCFGLSPVDAATGVCFKFPLSIGDQMGSFGSASSLLRMPGLEHVPAGLDALSAARDAAAKLRVLACTAKEIRISSHGDERLNGELAAYSPISGYGF